MGSDWEDDMPSSVKPGINFNAEKDAQIAALRGEVERLGRLTAGSFARAENEQLRAENTRLQAAVDDLYNWVQMLRGLLLAQIKDETYPVFTNVDRCLTQHKDLITEQEGK